MNKFSICKCTLYFVFRQRKKYLVFSVNTVILTDGSFCYFYCTRLVIESFVKSENIYLPVQLISINGQKGQHGRDELISLYFKIKSS